MKVMLDTNACIFLIKRRSPRLLARVQRHVPGEIGVSSITVAELEYGVAKSSRPEQNRQALAEFLLPLEIATFDERAVGAYGRIRAVLERQGTPIGSLDTLLAAHAFSLNATLVTNNTKEFRRIPKLKVADWT